MRKYVVICVTLAALAWVGVAAADPPQGKLTGQATIGNPLCCSNFIIPSGSPVIDGGTSYVGLENDKSGNCNGDSGQVLLGALPVANVVCAHYVASSGCCTTGSPKMRFAVQHPLSGVYLIFRITDNGPLSGNVSPDNWAEGPGVDTLAEARAIVNKGRIGGDFAATPWIFADVAAGDFTVTAAQ